LTVQNKTIPNIHGSEPGISALRIHNVNPLAAGP